MTHVIHIAADILHKDHMHNYLSGHLGVLLEV